MNIKIIQRNLLSLLKEFESFCKKNSIKYTLHGGTLLGAIRENGFIPWDDDIDIAMSRKDFNKLVYFLKKGIEYFDYDFDENPYKIFYNENNIIVWLDIFVYDYISPNHISQRMKIIFEDILMSLLKDDKVLATTKEKWSYPKYLLIKIVSIIGKIIPINIRKKMLYHVREKSFCGNKQFVHRSNDHHGGRLEILPKSILDDFIYVKFEDTELMVSKEYEKILIASYGKDYMIPKKPDSASLLGHKLAKNVHIEKKHKK